MIYWREVFPDDNVQNNLNYFLLDIGDAIIDYVEPNCVNAIHSFESSCSNWLFSHTPWRRQPDLIDKKTLDIFQLTDNFLDVITKLYRDYKYGEDIFISHKEYSKRRIDAFDPYINELLSLLNIHAPVEFTQIISIFVQDYTVTLNAVLQDHININIALTEILYWKNAIPDIILQEALVSLLYKYIAYKMQLAGALTYIQKVEYVSIK
jgi:hypothetical protein